MAREQADNALLTLTEAAVESGSGHRIGAIRQLRWSDVDFDRQVVRWEKANDKIGLEHETPVTVEALEALRKARRQAAGIGEAWVFQP